MVSTRVAENKTNQTSKMYPSLSDNHLTNHESDDTKQNNHITDTNHVTSDDNDKHDLKENPKDVTSKKSLWVTYLLWFFGGYFGLHQFYLGRDAHAFVTWMSFGAYFGMGWLRDMWRIPEYVDDANDDPVYMTKLSQQMSKHPKPESSMVRYCGMIIIADVMGYLVVGALPVELLPPNILATLCALLVPLGVACGIQLVGNIGRHESEFKYPLIGAYITAPLYFISSNSVFWTSLSSQTVFNKWGKKWRRTKSLPKPLWKRLLFLFLAASLYLSLWTSWIYFNCTIIDKDDEEIKCRDAAKNFISSPFWMEFSSVMRDLWNYIKHHGWSGFWSQLVSSLDPSGETNALKVLNLTSSASEKEITSSYRKLTRLWHPDRHQDPVKKAEASEKFMEIQQSYEILSRKKLTRMKKNQKERDNPESIFQGHRDDQEDHHHDTKSESTTGGYGYPESSSHHEEIKSQGKYPKEDL